MLTSVIYVVALALQLSAGILLLIGSTSTRKKNIIKKYCELHLVIRTNKEGGLRNYEEFIQVAKSAWINKFAFAYLAIGYLISIWGELPDNKISAFVWVILISVIFIVIANIVSNKLSKGYGEVNFNEYPLADGTVTLED